jgi:nucleotide-binding universal stress UspA family protein
MSIAPKLSVVVPVDLSVASYAAVTEALEHVERPDQVHVLHVLPPIDPDEFESVWSPRDPDSRIAAARATIKADLAKKFPHGIQVHVVLGEPAPAIAEFAQEQNAQLVVIASRGLSGLARLFDVSVSEQVIRLCHCPVFVIGKRHRPAKSNAVNFALQRVAVG